MAYQRQSTTVVTSAVHFYVVGFEQAMVHPAGRFSGVCVAMPVVFMVTPHAYVT
jgi:hypothetical protein